MKLTIIIVLISMVIFAGESHSHTYTCVHDELYKDYHPHKHKHEKQDQPLLHHIHGRQMAVLSRTPIRITLDTSDFDSIKAGANGASNTTSSRL